MTTIISMNYDDLYEKILSIVGLQISKFEQNCLLIHTILLKKGFVLFEKDSFINDDWNKEPNKCLYKYNFQNIEYELQIQDKSPLDLQLISRKSIYSDPLSKSNFSLNLCDFKVDFSKLNETVQSLEEMISINLLNSKKKLNSTPMINNGYFNQNINPLISNNPSLFYPESSIFDPNPFFNSGGVGGNLVGPNSNIFRPNQPNIRPKYDPIGPFGNFGGPDKKKPFGKDFFGGNDGFI